MFYFGLRRTFYPEYTLQPCAVLCQKGHTVWNSGSTFHQFWVEKKRRKAAYHPLTLCSLSHAGLPHLLCPFSLLVAQTSSKYLQQLCGDCSTRFIFSVFVVLLLVVDHLHVSILLDPQLAHDDVVNTTCRVCPCVGFIVPGGKIKTLRWILPIFSTLKLVYRSTDITRVSVVGSEDYRFENGNIWGCGVRRKGADQMFEARSSRLHQLLIDTPESLTELSAGAFWVT